MKLTALLVLTTATAISLPAAAQNIGYISSASGFMLYRSGNIAITANWQGQKPITNFSGYGSITMDRLCLTGARGQQPLTWAKCVKGSQAQTWKYSNGKLNNEFGWCADVEGNRTSAGARVLAWKCHNESNQRWKAHRVVSGASTLKKVRSPVTRKKINDFLNASKPGQTLILEKSDIVDLKDSGLIGLDGASIIGLDGASLISAGGMNLISAGGMN